jgi:hypothetical protein
MDSSRGPGDLVESGRFAGSPDSRARCFLTCQRSLTTQGLPGACDSAPGNVVFTIRHRLDPPEDITFAARYSAHQFLCLRLRCRLTPSPPRLEAVRIASPFTLGTFTPCSAPVYVGASPELFTYNNVCLLTGRFLVCRRLNRAVVSAILALSMLGCLSLLTTVAV